MRIRLNCWQQIGVVLSVHAFVGIGIYAWVFEARHRDSFYITSVVARKVASTSFMLCELRIIHLAISTTNNSISQADNDQSKYGCEKYRHAFEVCSRSPCVTILLRTQNDALQGLGKQEDRPEREAAN